jgi:hypothetical protein
MEKERIAYVAPAVVDLGPSDALYGGDECAPVGSVALENCGDGGNAQTGCGPSGLIAGGTCSPLGGTVTT